MRKLINSALIAKILGRALFLISQAAMATQNYHTQPKACENSIEVNMNQQLLKQTNLKTRKNGMDVTIVSFIK